MAENKDGWRARLESNRDRDREQIEGFFESARGRVFVFVGLGIFVVALLWNVFSPMVASLFGGGS